MRGGRVVRDGLVVLVVALSVCWALRVDRAGLLQGLAFSIFGLGFRV